MKVGRRASQGLVVLVASLVTLSACARIKVSSDMAPGTDLARRVTYVWHATPGRLPTDPRIDREAFDRDIRAQVDESLRERGFRPAAAGAPPDLIVAYRAFLKVKTDVGAVNDPVGFATGWGAYQDDEGYRTADSGGTYVTEWEQGRLDIDLLEPSGKRLLWRGTAKTELDFTNPPKERTRRLQLAVAKIIEQLPPR
jgi:hypothetical protein